MQLGEKLRFAGEKKINGYLHTLGKPQYYLLLLQLAQPIEPVNWLAILGGPTPSPGANF